MQKSVGLNSRRAKERRSGREKRVNTLMIALGACGGAFVLCLILWGLLGDFFHAPDRVKALKVGNVTYTAADFNFYYFSAYHDLVSKSQGSETLMGLDPSKNLADQPCTVSDEKMSWQEYFTRQATDTLSRMSVSYSEAMKAGYTMTKSISGTVDDVMEYYRVQAESAGYSDFASYLTATYGKGMTEDALRGLMEKTYIGKAYTDDLESKYHFTEGELKAYYSKHADENAAYSYLYAYVGGSGQAGLCKQLAAAGSGTEFESLTKKLTGSQCYTMKNVSGSDLGASSAKDVVWLSASGRKAGDTYVDQSGNRYVLYFLSRDDNGYAGSGGTGWISLATAGLKSDTFASWQNGMVSKYGVTEYSGMKYARSLT